MPCAVLKLVADGGSSAPALPPPEAEAADAAPAPFDDACYALNEIDELPGPPKPTAPPPGAMPV